MSAQDELIAVSEDLLERAKEDRDAWLDSLTLHGPDGEPDRSTLDDDERDVIEDYDAAIARAEAAIAKAKAGES